MLETTADHATARLRPGWASGGAESGSAAPTAVASAAVALLDQCAALVRRANARAYTGDSRVLKGGTIGKHVRHTLDHFRAALDGSGSGEVVDYDVRERNVPMESDPASALHAIAIVRERLARVTAADMERPVRVRVMLCADGQHAELGSTLGRELAFAAHHAVHHHAMVAAIAAEFGLSAPDDFGKAPSTIHHERAAGQAVQPGAAG